mmetsp:Transcript_2679/g.6094  ORF Transcript_2679/g.6094 Transcript_2679/m.6094 type:complete len:153 (-) Transcript_2679:319-777(-)
MGQTQSVSPPTELPGGVVKNDNQSPSTISREQQQKIAKMIESESNPSLEDSHSHNFGQPIRPPHHSSSSTSASSSSASPASTTSTITNEDKSGGASKLITDCRIQQRASLSCIEENYHNKDEACRDFFAAYKLCRREEHERKLEANARASAW